jgi:6-phosphogluconolactonase
VTIRVFDAWNDLSRAAADRIVCLANEAIDRRGRFVVALAGGTTPRRTYELLANAPCREAIPWADVHVCWGDERMVPQTDEASNYRMACERLLKYVDVSADHVHRIPTERGEAAEVAAAYERTLQGVFASTAGQAPSFDLILLGMGADGHTASLFPGSPALDERTHIVAAPWVPSLDAWRITITPPVIEHARDVMVLAGGGGEGRRTARGD